MSEILLKNGYIIDMTKESRVKKDILIENGLIKKIYDPNVYRCQDVIDINDKTIMPGFIDSHVHLIPSCIDEFSLNLEKATSIQEVLNMIKAKRESNPHIDMIIGSRLTEFALKEKRVPTMEELDDIVPDIPVFLSSIEFHTITVNSFALHKLKLPIHIEKIIKDEKGYPTGQMINEASILARRKMYEMLPDDMMVKGLEKTYRKIIEKGVTSVIAIEGGYLFHSKHVDFLLKNKNNYATDVSILFSTTDIGKVKAYDFKRIGGDIFFDGSFRSRNAAISEPYSDTENVTGKLFFSNEEIDDFLEEAIKENLQVSVHGVGNVGIKKLLDAYERVLRRYPDKNIRHKIEHFELPDPEDIKRVKALGLVLTMHPTYEYFFREKGGMYDNRLGTERALKTNPFRQIVDAGIIVAGGSDSHVMPIDPILGIHSAVNHPNIASRITPYEALKMFTINAAYGNHEEDIKGTIEVGKFADLVILSDDPLTIKQSDIKEIEVLMTMKQGQILYAKGE